MDFNLISSIHNAIKNAVSATTEYVFFNYLPDSKLLDRFTVVFQLSNNSNESTFDTREFIKNYQLEIKLNCKDLNSFNNSSIYIRNSIYNLEGSAFSYCALSNEDLFWDSDNGVWTNYIRFELQ